MEPLLRVPRRFTLIFASRRSFARTTRTRTLERKTTDTSHGSTTRLAGTMQAASAADGATSGVRRRRVDPRGHAQQGVGMRAAASDTGL
jgi:hypothetical protein